MITIKAGQFAFAARWERDLAPRTCEAFERRLPFVNKVIHVRWSGEGMWIPLADLDFGVGYENATCYPAPGQIILHPGSASETEILIAYGSVNFASKAGQLAGNHFLTIVDGLEDLARLGKSTLWEGAHNISFA